MDNKNIKNEIIEEIVDIESNWYSAFKEFLIFSGVTFLLYCNYYLTKIISSMANFHFSTMNKIQEEMYSQISYMQRYSYYHRVKVSNWSALPTETTLLQSELKNNEYLLMSYVIIAPILFAISYLLFSQLNLRSRFRLLSAFVSFIIVTPYFLFIEFEGLVTEGNGMMFVINCLIPFLLNLFLCLFVLLTPKNGKFSYYN